MERASGVIRSAAASLFVALALVPSLAFLALVLAGRLAPAPALLAWGLCTAVAVAFSALLGRDVKAMTRLLRALRRAPESLPDEPALLVPGMRELGEEAIRLIRAERLSRARQLESAAEDRALVERLPDPLLKLDAEANILWRNASAATAFSGEIAALLRHPDVRAALAEALRDNAPVRREIVLAAPVTRDLHVTLIPAAGPLYLLVSDRTHERAVEKMRADFIANASHELRTPLASLSGFIETLRGPAADDPEAQQRFLGIMAEQAARMQRLIGDLLSLSRIEISEHSPPKELVHLPPVLERVAAGLEPLLRASGTRLEVNVPPDLPKIPADADQLAQVFSNLLDNALKYGKPGGVVRLSATVAPDTRFEPGGVSVSVADNGPGIPREHIPRLTERFYRVDKGRSRAVGGTGLGLAIVKHVINRHRGRLAIDSDPGKGSVFTVWLPGRAG
ncbi:ATP-binding protein [Acidocella sp. KAb 2-4]|uniref:ATP-binding protein n=1 Tax=Acidocella sp. KAb 2-4 TaxID=2885158 RepID=UPI001D0609AB|nr:ATP-binding protein [Acidocella sp. KAb 2-4]MCB5943299.1 histidine kinase [Acidocella sp. KAb 2-4]